jgi:serine/threonine protein kinase
MLWMAEHQLQSGKYVIKEILGAGAYGITYKALHTYLDAYVAIKTVNKTASSLGEQEYQKYVLGFKEEGRILEKISKKFHPNIVRVRDFFEENGFPCLVMDFVEGESLMQLVRRERVLPPEEIFSYIRQISEALVTVHDAGLVHRDVQPCNILIQRNGKAVLIDFGITKSQISLTQNGLTASGTLSYAPEEQFRGDRRPTVDIFALAASLYYGVTGKHPESYFDRRVMETELTPPKQLVPQLSNHLNSIIMRGMDLDPKLRPQSIQEWIFLLNNVIVFDSINIISSKMNDLIITSPTSIPDSLSPDSLSLEPISDLEPISEPSIESVVMKNLIITSPTSIPDSSSLEPISEPSIESVVIRRGGGDSQELFSSYTESRSESSDQLDAANPEQQPIFKWGWVSNAILLCVVLPVTISTAPQTNGASLIIGGTLAGAVMLWNVTRPRR